MRTTKLWALVLLLSLFSISCRADICQAAAPTIPFSGNVANVQVSIDHTGNIFALGLTNPGGAIEVVIYSAQTQTWSSPPDMLSTSTASAPIIETDSKGNAIAVWFQGTEVWASFYDAITKTWTTSQQISSTASASSATAQIGFLGNTGGMVIWAASDGTDFVESSTFDGASWQTCAQTVPQTGAISEVHLGTTDSGHALALWLHGSTPFASVYHPNTHCWGIPQSFTNPITTTSLSPILATSKLGPSAASWLTHTGSLYALELLPISVPLSIDQYLSFMIDSFDTQDQFFHQGAISPNGNSFHLWQRAEDGNLVIKANSINTLTGAGSDIVELAPSFTFNFQNPQLQLEADNHGSAIAAWVDPTDSTDIKQATYSAQLGTWGSPETISATAPVQNLTLSVNGVGNYAVAWIESGSAMVEFDNTPAAPSNLTVYENTNRFPFQGENSHQLSWTASTSPDIVQYKVYKENTLLKTLPSSTTSYKVHNCPANTIVTYYIYSVSAQGLESLAASVTFNPQH